MTTSTFAVQIPRTLPAAPPAPAAPATTVRGAAVGRLVARAGILVGLAASLTAVTLGL